MKTLCREERPEKRTYSWEEGLSSLPDGKWAGAELQREMKQDEVKLICQGSAPSKMGILLRGRVALFAGGWVRCGRVPKKDDAEKEKNDGKIDKGSKKGKYK